MTENGPPRRVRVDFEALIAAYEDPDYEQSFFLDIDSGEIVAVLESDFEEEDLHPIAATIDSHPGRFLPLPDRDPDDLLEDLAAYAREAGAEDLLAKVKAAFGNGLTRAGIPELFTDHSELLENWDSYRESRQRQRLLTWLASHNVEPAETSPSSGKPAD